MVLLVGTIVGGIAQVGEAAAIGLTSIWPNTPAVFTSGSGRLLMAIATVFIIAPLCLVRRLRQVYIYVHSFLPACTASSFSILVARCTHRIFDERQKSMEKKILQTLLRFATFLLQFFHALFSRLLEKLQGFLTKIFSDIARASLKPELR